MPVTVLASRQVPVGGNYTPPTWHGNLYAACCDCDPTNALRLATSGGSIAVTPTNLTISLARIIYFKPPANIVLNKIRFYGVGATTNVFRVAIYNGNTLARLTAELPITTVANAFGSVGTALNITLVKDQLYFIAVSVNAVGTVAGMLCLSPTQAATTGMVAVLPRSFPGNLSVNLGFNDFGFGQFAVTNGALPGTAPTIAEQTAWTGGFPLFFLDNNNV